MGKLEEFYIALDNKDNVYYAGEKLTAILHLTLNKPKKMKKLQIKFKGEAVVQWKQLESRTEMDERHGEEITKNILHTYYSEEEYFNMKFPFWDHESGGSEYHPAGNFEYPVEIMLPHKLPSSFDSTFGSVRFYAEGKIYKPWKQNHRTRQMFTVIGPVDLNDMPEAKMPFRAQDDKMTGCLCCKNGPVSVNFSLPKTGYVPGESIPISAEIQNNSSSTIKSVTVNLRLRLMYKAKKHKFQINAEEPVEEEADETRTENRTLATVELGRVEENQSMTKANEPIQIPVVPPSDSLLCNVLQIDYFLDLNVDVSMAFDMDYSTGILIGTVPLPLESIPQPLPSKSEKIELQKRSNVYRYPGYPVEGPNIGAPVPPPYFDIQTFEECTLLPNYMQEKDKDKGYVWGEQHYVPRYTYYNF